MAIYIRLKEIREVKGMTQNEVAIAIGLQLSGLQKIEYHRNKSIPYETLDRLCNLFDCAPGDLLVIEDKEEKRINAIAILEDIIPYGNQKWTKDYKAKIYHGILSAIAALQSFSD